MTTTAVPERETVSAPIPETPAIDRSLYLLGRPTLRQFLRFVRDEGVDPPSRAEALELWNGAYARIQARERTERGIADAPPYERLGPDYHPLLREFLRDPLVRHGFNTVPTEVALVPLDRLVVWQHHIDLSHVERLAATLRADLSDEELFRVCLPFDHPAPPVGWCQAGAKKFVFRSPSNDLRFLGPMELDPGNIVRHAPPGALVGVVGLAVGFGSNFLNAIKVEGRLLLNNGSHRAYALRRAGYSHVPCIIQHARSREELTLVGSTQVRKYPDEHLTALRPPMLPDYFDPELQLTLEVHRRARQVTIRFEVEEESVPL